MNNMLKLSIILCLFIGVSYAVEEEVVLNINGYSVTNIDILKRISTNYPLDVIGDASSISYFMKKELPYILSEYYAVQNEIKVTEQEVTDGLNKVAGKSRKSIDEFLESVKRKTDLTIEKTEKRWRQSTRDSELAQKVVRHYTPNIVTLTEADIQGFVDYYRKSYSPSTFGHREAVQFRSILILPEALATDESLHEELEDIKHRLNKGVKFEDIAGEFSDRKEFLIGTEPGWQLTNEFNREGLSSLVPWVTLKNKVVIVSLKAAVGSPPMLIQITDYRPNTRKEVGDALKNKYLRNEVLESARSHKFGKARREMIKDLKAKIKYIDGEEKAYQKLANEYESWWIETYKDLPDFQQHLKDLRARKVKYFEMKEMRDRKAEERRAKKED